MFAGRLSDSRPATTANRLLGATTAISEPAQHMFLPPEPTVFGQFQVIIKIAISFREASNKQLEESLDFLGARNREDPAVLRFVRLSSRETWVCVDRVCDNVGL